MENKKAKGIGLLSGGLDSILAVKVLQQQQLRLIGVIFATPFFGPTPGTDYEALLNVPVRVIDIGEKHLEMLRSPVYGYGSQMNPCIDCHALMLHEAGELMVQEGADFLFTGEVLGQRPMSQRRDALRSVEKLSGYSGRVLRPLSAKLLPPTLVETEGLVDRDKLLDIQGRSRKRQMALAEQFDIKTYPQPGGGCMLTKQGFVKKLRALFALYTGVGVREAQAISYGRMFQLPGGHLCLVGRHQADNERLEALGGPRDFLLRAVKYPGPRALLLFSPGIDRDLDLAASILASYSDAPVGENVQVEWKSSEKAGLIEQRAQEKTCFKDYMI